LFRYQPWLHAREVVALHAELGRIPPARRHGAIEDALALVGLTDRADDPVSAFSKGMQQRLGLGVALLGDPDLVLLDEPTSALDPLGRTDVRAIVRAARDRGATVILNSHLLTEVERVCDRVIILHRGRMIASGSLDEVVAADGVRLRVTDLGDASRAAAATFGAVTIEGDWLSVRPLAADRIPDLVAALVATGGRVHAVEPGRGSLEARFLELLAESGGTDA
jgi:ABC-2 type transport system ATP-binding protein